MTWKVQFKQRFNGQISQCTTEVEATDVRDALRKFDAISYVNATVNAVFRPKAKREEANRERGVPSEGEEGGGES